MRTSPRGKSDTLTRSTGGWALALFQVGGSAWKKWEEALTKTLLDHQRGWHESDTSRDWTNEEQIDEYGSWDPMGMYYWDDGRGRVGMTAMAEHCLAIYYGYLRLAEHD